ncbi:AEC family transporter [Sanguibacter massiliensis]|uniref:AEC family transporter n=1 Tax=Sanguibacter massiliensis TaxID=1973217 RepID=UPI000C82A192|nr:AEC family transporter [Sanguibacter massiliensis]
MLGVLEGYTIIAVVRGWWRRPVGETTIGALGAGYVNANNIGLPVATYILGEPAAVAPVILAQLLLLAPAALAVLDAASSGTVSWRRVLTQPVRNPIILGSAAGLAAALTGVTVPDVVMEPLRILGGGAVPLMLVAFGISLAGTRLLKAGTDRRNVTLATALKLIGMPLAAWAIGTALGLDGHDLYVVVVLAALPTAQNVLNYADRYRTGQVVARDTIALTTLGAPPVMAVVALLLH